MDAGFTHNILVVDDESAVTRAIGRILDKQHLSYVLADSGEAALKQLRSAARPFSIVITDQRMERMKGTELLEHARTLCPDTRRFLMTAYSDIETIINAVNKGAIQCYIRKPWEMDAFIEAVRRGLSQFELRLESEKLLKLAKQQSAKLYELNCELMEKTTAHNKESRQLDRQIKEIEAAIQSVSSKPGMSRQALAQRIIRSVSRNDRIDAAALEALFNQTIIRLHDQFSDLAHRNGFEMPVPKEGPC